MKTTTKLQAYTAAAMAGIAASPILSHMRKVAYSPVTLLRSRKNDTLHIQKAEEKRLRKQQKRLPSHTK